MKPFIAASVAAALFLGAAGFGPSSAQACGIGKAAAHQSIADPRAPGASEIGNGFRNNPSTGKAPPGNGGWLSTCNGTFHKKS
jgi:hypothetical protein